MWPGKFVLDEYSINNALEVECRGGWVAVPSLVALITVPDVFFREVCVEIEGLFSMVFQSQTLLYPLFPVYFLSDL